MAKATAVREAVVRNTEEEEARSTEEVEREEVEVGRGGMLWVEGEGRQVEESVEEVEVEMASTLQTSRRAGSQAHQAKTIPLSPSQHWRRRVTSR